MQLKKNKLKSEQTAEIPHRYFVIFFFFSVVIELHFWTWARRCFRTVSDATDVRFENK